MPTFQVRLQLRSFLKKRENVTFRYREGPNKGKKIIWSKLSDGRVVKMPYDKMRALAFDVGGRVDTSIHSTTEDDSIGKKSTWGCLRMTVDDLLKLFPLVKEGTKIIIF